MLDHPDHPVVKSLDAYDMSEEQGFLCRHDAGEVKLPGVWGEAAKTAMKLPEILPSGRVREYLDGTLPAFEKLDLLSELSEAQIRMAMVHYSFMVQAYVWGEAETGHHLPSSLARPMVALADHLGQQPLLPYSGYVLDNWALLDPSKPLSLDNIYMIQNFLSGQDEAWFVLVHVAIEAKAGKALAQMGPITEAVKADEAAEASERLQTMAAVWKEINQIFDRMPEQCDPYIYFERVRPYIHGWKDNPALPNGVTYEGVDKFDGKGQAFRGQTGSQSSIVPSMDALLGVGHAADPLKDYLDQLHFYRPPGHRQFIDDVRGASRLRDYVKTKGDQKLANAYNANIQAVADFRSRHLEYAATYINKQGKGNSGNDTEVGTGGTPFMRYLKKHRDETQANLIQL